MSSRALVTPPRTPLALARIAPYISTAGSMARSLTRLSRTRGRRARLRRKPRGVARRSARTRGTTSRYNMRSSRTRRRRVPRRSKRMVRTINRVINSRLGTRQMTFTSPNELIAAGGVAGNYQAWGSSSLFGSNTNATREKDLFTIFSELREEEHGVPVDLNAMNTDRLTIQSANMEMNFRNEDQVHAQNVIVYTVVPKFDTFPSGYTALLHDAFANGFNATESINGKPKLNAANWGVSPFDNKKFCGEFTVIGSRQYQLSPGESATFSYAHRRPKQLTYRRIGNANYTRGNFVGFLYRLQPIGMVPAVQVTSNMRVQWRKTYQVKRIEDNESSATAL